MNHNHIYRFLHLLLLSALAFFVIMPTPTQAKNGNSQIIIRDTEIENMLKRWAEPVIKAAELEPDAVNFIIIQNSDINAFVAGGPNIFLYTGLLTKSKNADEIIGVIAHELGHIRGGHLIRTREAAEYASYESILGTLIGIGAAIITGESGAAATISAGTRSVAERRFLAFNRIQESSADQAALEYLEKAALNPNGLLSFMRQLESQELLPPSQQYEYIRTHPLTRSRVQAIDEKVKKSAYKNLKLPDRREEEHARMIAKLIGFISPERVVREYGTEDQSIAAHYARAIAAYRQNNIKEALTGMDRLLAKEPKNPFFLELRAQMLVNFGMIRQALPYYKKAIGLSSHSPMIRIAYAHALIESTIKNDKKSLQKAINQLERAVRDDPRAIRPHRLLATAYGRLGNEGAAHLYLAEEALLKRKTKDTKKQAGLALQKLEEGSRHWLRAKDIIDYIDNNDKG